MTRMLRPKGHQLLLVIALTLCFGTAPAWASSSIEGVWEFNGGKVAVRPLPGGTFLGVVVDETKFAGCAHPVGQEMWTNIRQQSDGSYWGLHQWYLEPGCALNSTLGPTAWRVLVNEKGEDFLKVCFSTPESGVQPTIAANGTTTNVTYSCKDSAPIAKLPTQETSKSVVSLPTSARCVSRRSLTIKLHEPQYDPLKEAVVWVRGKKVADIRSIKRLKKGILLKKLPTGSYTVKVRAVTVLDRKLVGTRHYKSCAPGSGNINLKGTKHTRKKHKKA